MRIMATLEWLNSSHQLQYARTPAHKELNKMLVLFLNNLVAGHMMDPQLDTQNLIDMMIAPLLADTTPLGRLNFQPLSNLRTVILKRVPKSASGAGTCNSDPPIVALSTLGLQNGADMHVTNSDHVASGSRLNVHAISFQPKDIMSRNRQ